MEGRCFGCNYNEIEFFIGTVETLVFGMKITTTDDVKDLLGMNIASAALCAALELRLFSRLDENPLGAQDVSQAFNIPLDRCRCWLDLLVGLDLLIQIDGTYSPSSVARTAILGTYSSASL